MRKFISNTTIIFLACCKHSSKQLKFGSGEKDMSFAAPFN